MPSAVLLDLAGTLYTDAGAVPGGPEALAALRRRGIPFRGVTNTTTSSRAGLVERLRQYGYQVSPAEIVTPVHAAVERCRARGLRRVAAYLPEAALEDLAGLELSDTPEAIVVGDLGEGWSFALLQRAFSQILAGAELIALSKDRYFLKGDVLTLDAGLFVAGLEYASGRAAAVVGKPSPDFYHAAVASLGRRADAGLEGIVMVGDDLWSDVGGAQRAGLEAWLVRTGKFREEKLRESGIVPDRVIGSVAEIAATI
jgi:HAD superfamily hydrolase (TIGR01458 family)